ncbi:two-component regulator propeller domain-containing protein [Mucilaginibacter calamicampi]|uniref:histidine kinase n=1 Tax=Mucilaginibacter calamicampi TaxID=1302352 RepID=A0ABW2Z221_9SPHI
MLKHVFFYFVIFFCMLLRTGFAQERELNFINLASNDGLSSNIVNTIFKDKYGYMWYGTDGGLNRFDGKEFTVYRHAENDTSSLLSNDVHALCEDKNGNLWIGTSVGMAMYDRKLDCFVNRRIVGLLIFSITLGPDDKLWLGTLDGVVVLDPTTLKFSWFKAKNATDKLAVSKEVQCVFRDNKKQLWVGNKTGLYLYNSKTQTFKPYAYANTSEPGDNSISSIAQDKKGNIWVGTYNGVSMVVPGSNSFKNYKHRADDNGSLSSNLVYALAAEPGGDIWIGTEEGLDILNPASGTVRRIERDPRNNYSLIGKAVKTILIDRDNIFWVGTYRCGVNKYDKNLAFFDLRQSNHFDLRGLSADVVTSFAAVDSNGVYVGTDGGGLNFYDFKTGLFTHLPLFGNSTKEAILAMERVGSEIWIGTFLHGLFIYDTNTGQSRHITKGTGPQNLSGNDIFCIKRDSRGNVWLGTNGQGVNMYNPSTKIFYRYSKHETGSHFIPLNGYIRAIEEDRAGNILIGSSGAGMVIYNPFKGKAVALNSFNSELPKNSINTICVGADGIFWVGLSEGGLARFDDKKKDFFVYKEKDGLADEVIYKILEDNSGKIWVSTNKGISSFDRKLNKFTNYTHHNGLQRSPFVLGAGLKLANGTLLFGGTNGFNYGNPEHFSFSKKIPRVVLTQLRISNKNVVPSPDAEIKEHISIAKEIDIDQRQNFSLSFIALDFTSPHESKYLYKLDKFDRDWINIGDNNTVSYTNLDPGQYTFYVKAVSENGSWTSPTTSIIVNVRPPFWKTYYAYAFYILLVALILLYSRYRAIEKLETKFALEQERQTIAQERREAEQRHSFDQMRIKLLTNLSHEFRTPISLIMGPVDQLLHIETSTPKADQLGMIRRNARRLLNLVNQLLDFRNMEDKELRLNPTVGDFIAFTLDVVESFKDLSERRLINFEIHSSLKFYFASFDHEKIERILFNLLSNAFKFTLSGGEVTLSIKKDEHANGLIIQLTDTGIGIAEEDKEKIFDRFFQSDVSSAILNKGSGIGLSLTREFVKLHGGTISVESVEKEGSTFTICLPLKCIDDEYNDEDIADDELDNPENLPATKLTEEVPYEQLANILLVEDNDDFRLYLKDNLKTSYRVEEATNGKDGWQKVLFSHPQLVISDISMPQVSGIDLCRKIKSDKRTSHIPVLLLTALTGEENQLLGLEIGANDYITKPFNMDILNAKIRNLLELNERLKTTYSKQINLLAPETKIESNNEKLMSKVVQYIEENLTNSQLSIEGLSRKLVMSRGSLYTKILELTGKTPVDFVRSVRLDKAVILLEKSDMTVSQVSYAVGFSTPNYFARAFKTQFNMKPSEYIQLKRENKSPSAE